MRRFYRVVMLAVLLGIAPVLAGCENFDPDKLDVFGLNKKKPLPGDRKALFPEGVPGVAQGIPPEYLQGNVQQQTGAALDVAQTPPGEPGAAPAAAPAAAAASNAKTAAVEPAPEPKPKAKTKPTPKKRVVKRAPAADPAVQPSQTQNAQGQQQPAPWPTQAQAQPAAQQAPAPWPEPSQNGAAPWPSAPPPGTFSK